MFEFWLKDVKGIKEHVTSIHCAEVANYYTLSVYLVYDRFEQYIWIGKYSFIYCFGCRGPTKCYQVRPLPKNVPKNCHSDPSDFCGIVGNSWEFWETFGPPKMTLHSWLEDDPFEDVFLTGKRWSFMAMLHRLAEKKGLILNMFRGEIYPNGVADWRALQQPTLVFF